MQAGRPRRATPARWPENRSCGSFSTAPWCACGSTAKRPRSRCSLSSACARTARRCCWRSRAWAARAPRHGALSSTISSSAGCERPEFLVVDGAAGLDKAIAAVWDGVPVQRCTVHKHRNLLAPRRLQRYLHVIGDRATPNSNHFPDGTHPQRLSMSVAGSEMHGVLNNESFRQFA